MSPEQDGHSAIPCARCQKPATLQCPKCLELKLERDLASYCSQECFKESWAEHKRLHKPSVDGWHYCTRKGEGRSLNMPDFRWTGALRPARIGPPRPIPDSIPKPDYYRGGYPTSEVESRQQQAVPARSANDIAGIREACRIGRLVLDAAHAAVRPGVTTDEIDRVVHETTLAHGGYPSPFNYYHFPKSVCTSINEVICHGIPDRRPLESGDIVNVDVSVYKNGYHGDLNETFVVGEVDEEGKKLVKVTHECLQLAIAACRPGVRYREIGDIITKHATANGFSVVKTYCGHGIGDLFHCAPNIPHYAHNKAKGVMQPGQTFTIEPMINVGSHRDKTWPDGWTAVTEDGKRSAQFEHTLLITRDGCEVLTHRLPTSPPLWWEKPWTLAGTHNRATSLDDMLSPVTNPELLESWVEHKKLHKPSVDGWHYCTQGGKGRSLNMPDYRWTGPLRPARVGPPRPIPDSIPKPNYYRGGYPTSEIESRQQRVVPTRSERDIAGIREACRIGRLVLDAAHAAVRPGVTTDELDRIVHETTLAHGAYPSPFNYYHFPKSVCSSINEDGDIVNVDVSVYKDGYHSDLNETFVVGEVDEEGKKVIRVAYECLQLAIAACKPGVRYREIGDIIAKHATANGFSVVKSYCGHGTGDLFHCAPDIPHYAHNKAKGVMQPGQTFTIEPMINVGSHRDKTWPDGWTAVTEDGKRSAQFEHMLLITRDGCEVLTQRLPTSPPLWWEEE